jgi:hypothetical protein
MRAVCGRPASVRRLRRSRRKAASTRPPRATSSPRRRRCPLIDFPRCLYTSRETETGNAAAPDHRSSAQRQASVPEGLIQAPHLRWGIGLRWRATRAPRRTRARRWAGASHAPARSPGRYVTDRPGGSQCDKRTRRPRQGSRPTSDRASINFCDRSTIEKRAHAHAMRSQWKQLAMLCGALVH